jgi:hypothetical protein
MHLPQSRHRRTGSQESGEKRAELAVGVDDEGHAIGPLLALGSWLMAPVLASEVMVETLLEVVYKAAAFTSPVDEVVAWGEDTWP